MDLFIVLGPLSLQVFSSFTVCMSFFDSFCVLFLPFPSIPIVQMLELLDQYSCTDLSVFPPSYFPFCLFVFCSTSWRFPWLYAPTLLIEYFVFSIYFLIHRVIIYSGSPVFFLWHLVLSPMPFLVFLRLFENYFLLSFHLLLNFFTPINFLLPVLISLTCWLPSQMYGGSWLSLRSN